MRVDRCIRSIRRSIGMRCEEESIVVQICFLFKDDVDGFDGNSRTSSDQSQRLHGTHKVKLAYELRINGWVARS